jgi:hypothetical protein
MKFYSFLFVLKSYRLSKFIITSVLWHSKVEHVENKVF